MKSRSIYLIRHGESESNANPNIQAEVPDYKIQLTPKGELQAQHAGKILDNTLLGADIGVYVSPFARARNTWYHMCQEISSIDVSFIKEDPRLREQEWGHLRQAEHADAIDKERQAYGTFFYRIPDGESGADVYDRCSGFLDTLYRDFQKDDFPENVLIVTHGFTIRVLLMRWLHWSVETFHTLKNPSNCQLFELELNTLTDKYDLKGDFPTNT